MYSNLALNKCGLFLPSSDRFTLQKLIVRKSGCASEPVWVAKEFDPRIVQPAASSCTVHAIQAIGIQWKILQYLNPTKCNSVSKFYFIFIWSSACFGRHTAHHQEPKTALATSGFAYVKGCWTFCCWTLSDRVYYILYKLYLTAFSNYTANNPPRMQNQRLLVQF
jgi:hypothetical protein